MSFERFPIRTARFLKEGTEIVVGSQSYNYCYSYDLITGKTVKVPLPHGVNNMKVRFTVYHLLSIVTKLNF